MITIPEIIFKDTLTQYLKVIRDDYASQSDKQNSLLYQIFEDLKLDRYGLFEQGETVIVGAGDSPRRLEVNLGFNTERTAIPTIHILLRNDQRSDGNSIGYGEGDLGGSNGFYIVDEPNSNFKQTYNRRYKSTYDLLITSDNINEVLLIYHFFRSSIFSLSSHFEAKGIHQLSISGNDININTDIIEKAYMRSIIISFEHEVGSPQLFTNSVIRDIFLTITPKSTEE